MMTGASAGEASSSRDDLRSDSVRADEAGLRLDRWLRTRVAGVPQSRIQSLLRRGRIRVNSMRVAARHRLLADDEVSWPFSLRPSEVGRDGKTRSPLPLSPRMRATMEASILYEDAQLLAYDKPPGLAVQGGSGQRQSLDSLLCALFAARAGAQDDAAEKTRGGAQEGAEDAAGRPRILHRLDRSTGGVVVFAKTKSAARALHKEFRLRAVSKRYWALVVGVPQSRSGEVRLALAKRGSAGGQKMAVRAEGAAQEAGVEPKSAHTLWATIATVHPPSISAPLTWLLLAPLTGRTHQLRVHMSALGHPVLGDGKYGGRAARPCPCEGILLLARSLSLRHPADGAIRTFVAPPFPAFMRALTDFGFLAPADAARVATEGVVLPPVCSVAEAEIARLEEMACDFSS